MDEVKCSGTIDDRIGRHPLIESSQLALVRVSERQKIAVRNVCRIEKTFCVRGFTVEQG